MIFIRCLTEHLSQVTDFYRMVVRHLEETDNLPLWSQDHPSAQSIAQAVADGTQYICTDGGVAVGAVVLSENPEGDYEAGQWSRSLDRGEYLVIHTLAVSPQYERRGIGGFLVEQCVGIARREGYKAIRLDVVPQNEPAAALYRKHGFTYAGTKDLRRDIEGIPVFDLYERNIDPI